MRILAFLACLLLTPVVAFASSADEWGRPPLITALQARDAIAFERLLDAGADVAATDAWGRTPLLVATQMRDNAAVRRLLDRKPDVDAANRNDITPLIAASQTGNLEAARLLLDAGAAPNRRDNLGLTALDWAERRSLEPLAQLLRDRGAIRGAATGNVAALSQPASVAPFPPRHDFGRAIRGSASAPVTIYEYTDFQCPYCTQGARVLKEVMARYEGQVRVIVKHLPLPAIHPQAMRAAQYFEAISLQDAAKAWAFHDRVFAEQSSLGKGEEFLRGLALAVGADGGRLDRDLAGAEVEARIAADLRESQAYRFDGVPAFVVDGRILKGAQPPERFYELIDAALARRPG